MDFNNNNNNNSINELAQEDRISELPDSLLHYILSFLDFKCVFRTSLLSRRWNYIWTSIPTLYFSQSRFPEIDSDSFPDFVDRTLLHRDPPSSVQKFSLDVSGEDISASRVQSWISSVTKRNAGVEELSLSLGQLDKPIFIPVSLFTCESLVDLELAANDTTHIPRRFCFPKLKTLTLRNFRFTDDNCWNEQHFSNCPLLEDLDLTDCTWFGVRRFCIVTPALKFLRIENLGCMNENGLHDCDLRIYAPNLVYLSYTDVVAKDYELSSFVALESAVVYFYENDATSKQRIGYGAAVTKFFQALSHVQRLTFDTISSQVLLNAHDIVNNLPTFHNLYALNLLSGSVPDKVLFALLKAAPDLKILQFEEELYNDDHDDFDDGDIVYDETEELFQHLQSVVFKEFCGEGRDLRWVKLILKNAKSLQRMTIFCNCSTTKANDVLKSELSSLPRASSRCVFKLEA